MKKHNFSAGPSVLPDVALENAAKAIFDFNGTGISVLSYSHRSKEFEAVLAEAKALFRELLNIPENYHIYFVGGGASTQFFQIPANFLGKKAGYINTGVWTKKAIKEAKLYGEVEVIASSEDKHRIASDFSASVCEMEGCAIAQTALVNGTPFAVVRAISDSADGEATMDYPTFLGIASKNSTNLTLALVEKW